MTAPRSHGQQSRRALVTGAASGIGLALATLLSQRHHQLHLVDIDADGLAAAAAATSAATATPGNVADAATMQDLADEIGPVDLLGLNAGVISTTMGAPWEAPPDEWDRVLGVNLLGVVNGLRSFVPSMLERDTRSNILITASLAGAATWPGGGPYAASKHAVLAVAEQAALNLAGTNISVTVLCPALVRTGMSAGGADPAEVAAEALQAVEQERFAVVPLEWTSAIERRAKTLGDGSRPTAPEPS
ncbi:MAG: SDR family oxidoreductase [Acidimicrobiales bacterium]|nr:SDR family oxidoreductase [Acidimicrobiales bacterium]